MSRASIIARAVAAVGRTAGVTVTYDTGSVSFACPAIVGRTARNFFDERGYQTRVETRDYLIAVADLKDEDDVLQTPHVGHRITESLTGDLKTYEVLPLAGEPAWRFLDPQQTTYRIHTKLVTN